jgi:hypothetical protein
MVYVPCGIGQQPSDAAGVLGLMAREGLKWLYRIFPGERRTGLLFGRVALCLAEETAIT